MTINKSLMRHTNIQLSSNSNVRYFLLAIALTMLSMCSRPSPSFGRSSVEADTTGTDLECERIANILFNSEEYYYQLSATRQLRIDTLRAAITTMLEAKGLVLGAEKDIDKVVVAYNALDDSQKAEIAKLTKEVGKLERRKNFWKTMAFVEGGLVAIGTIWILIQQ